MTQIQVGSNTLLAVKVQSDAREFKVVNTALKQVNPPYLEWEYPKDENDSGTYDCASLPPGTWQIVGTGTAAQITEAEAKGIVGKFHDNDGWPGYYNYEDDCKTLLNRADLSLTSILAAHGFDPETTVLLIKK